MVVSGGSREGLLLRELLKVLEEGTVVVVGVPVKGEGCGKVRVKSTGNAPQR